MTTSSTLRTKRALSDRQLSAIRASADDLLFRIWHVKLGVRTCMITKTAEGPRLDVLREDSVRALTVTREVLKPLDPDADAQIERDHAVIHHELTPLGRGIAEAHGFEFAPTPDVGNPYDPERLAVQLAQYVAGADLDDVLTDLAKTALAQVRHEVQQAAMTAVEPVLPVFDMTGAVEYVRAPVRARRVRADMWWVKDGEDITPLDTNELVLHFAKAEEKPTPDGIYSIIDREVLLAKENTADGQPFQEVGFVAKGDWVVRSKEGLDVLTKQELTIAYRVLAAIPAYAREQVLAPLPFEHLRPSTAGVDL